MREVVLCFVVPGALAVLLASFLAGRLRRKYPDHYKSAGSPVSTDWHPFWVINFTARRKFQGLDVVTLMVSLVSSVLMVFAFLMGALLAWRAFI